ncbi:hypothetical protein PHYPSEUDO_011759 [Phytophthora pseudosyringae]|uniref:Uncharacterized protein n=1 Tax=Phytophthora pseudosyringae TaxID=221518 RepID=A0A8T1V7V5_9STRA|nr:hypothetical protein PHYPSEUDO_011759 [Phytophthora pseudosyringae]
MRLVMEYSLMLLLLALPALGLSPGDIGDVTTPPSGCELCASTGDCSLAFRDGPGQYCGTWMDRSSHELPCCCPLNAVCNVSPADYVCTCAYVGAMPPYHSESDLMTKVLWLWWIIGVFVVAVICGACGYFTVKQVANRGGESCMYAPPDMIVPVISPSREALYGSTGQTPALPTEPEAEEPTAVQGGGGVPAREGAAFGPAAGLLSGVVLASHPTPPDDLDVGGDGFDGGLGSLEKVEEVDEADEVESSDDVEAEEKIALLTVPTKE